MFSFFSDVAPLIEFLKTIQDGTIVLMATYDDGATKYVIDFKQQMLLKLLHAVLYWKKCCHMTTFNKIFFFQGDRFETALFSLLLL